MTTLTTHDAGFEKLPAIRAPLFEVSLHWLEQSIEIRVRAADREDAIRQVLEHRRGWLVGKVMRYQVGRWVPA